jgi:hypothetical protein
MNILLLANGAEDRANTGSPAGMGILLPVKGTEDGANTGWPTGMDILLPVKGTKHCPSEFENVERLAGGKFENDGKALDTGIGPCGIPVRLGETCGTM